MRRRIMMLICLFTFFLVSSAEAQMSEGEFVNVLDAFQNKVRNVEFVSFVREYNVVRGTGALKATPYYFRTRVVMADAPGGKVRFECEASTPWFGDDGKPMEKPAITSQHYAFNSKITTYIQWETPAMEAPLHQWVQPDRPSSSLRGASYQSTGLALISAYYDDAGLAQRLRETKNWTLKETAPGVFVIRVRRDEYPNDQLIREITVDLNRGGAITGIKDFTDAGPLGTEYRNIVLRDCGQGVWLPESAEYKRSATVLKFEFSTVKINQDIPDDVFSLKFVPGYQVWDRINNTKFMAGPANSRELQQNVDSALASLDVIMSTDAVAQTAIPVPSGVNSPSDTVAGHSAPSSSRMLPIAVSILLGGVLLTGGILIGRLRTRR